MDVAKKTGRSSTRDGVPGFGPAVRDRRTALGLTLADLAGQTGSTPSALSEIERGTRFPSLRLGLAIARALDIAVEVLATPPASPPARRRP